MTLEVLSGNRRLYAVSCHTLDAVEKIEKKLREKLDGSFKFSPTGCESANSPSLSWELEGGCRYILSSDKPV